MHGCCELDSFCNNALKTLGSLHRLAALVGAEPEAVRQRLAASSPLRAGGLLDIDRNPRKAGGFGIEWDDAICVSHAAIRAMVAPHADRAAWVTAMVGEACGPGLSWDDFAHLGAPIHLAADVLRAAAARGEAGVHVMLVGPPGTGKTELAQALAARAGLALRTGWTTLCRAASR